MVGSKKICLELVSEFEENDIPLAALQPDILVGSHGLGQNMAKSARFWLKATSILEENTQTKTAKFTDFGWSLLDQKVRIDIWKILPPYGEFIGA